MEKTIDLAPLAAVLYRKFDRESAMLEVGVRAFAPLLRFQENFCESVGELDEARTRGIRMLALRLTDNEAFCVERAQGDEEAAAREKASGHGWERGRTEFERRFFRTKATDPQFFDRTLRPYRDEQARLWLEEIEHFQNGVVDGVVSQGLKLPARSKLCRKLIGPALSHYGYGDKPINLGRHSLAFVKPVGGGYRFQWGIDLGLLNRPFRDTISSNPDGSDSFRGGPEFRVYLSLQKDEPETSQKFILLLAFNHFFPLITFGMHGYCYRIFYDLRELEGLIGIYLTLYGLIADELEAALKECVRSTHSS